MKNILEPLFILTAAALLLMALLSTGCTSLPQLKPGQAVVSETQIEGIDLSIPVPGIEGANIINLRFGFIQNKVYKGYSVPYISNSNYSKISLIKGEGSIARSLIIGIENGKAAEESNSIFSVGVIKVPKKE